MTASFLAVFTSSSSLVLSVYPLAVILIDAVLLWVDRRE
jgi:hypothetical protein